MHTRFLHSGLHLQLPNGCLRVVLATTTFSMEIDYSDIHPFPAHSNPNIMVHRVLQQIMSKR